MCAVEIWGQERGKGRIYFNVLGMMSNMQVEEMKEKVPLLLCMGCRINSYCVVAKECNFWERV